MAVSAAEENLNIDLGGEQGQESVMLLHGNTPLRHGLQGQYPSAASAGQGKDKFVCSEIWQDSPDPGLVGPVCIQGRFST
jgi:hypothetical protein